MTNDFGIVSTRDIEMPLEIGDVNSKVDRIVQQAIEKGDIEIALKAGYDLRQIGELAGAALARLIYKLHQNWHLFEIGDTFIDTVSSYLGLAEHTVERYVKVALLLDEAPDEYKEKLETVGVNKLIPIANAVVQGYDIEPKQWTDLLDAGTEAEVREIIRKDVKNAEPRRSSLRLYVDRYGAIWGYKENERKFVGSLELTDDSDIVQQACERIIRNSGMLKE